MIVVLSVPNLLCIFLIANKATNDLPVAVGNNIVPLAPALTQDITALNWRTYLVLLITLNGTPNIVSKLIL